MEKKISIEFTEKEANQVKNSLQDQMMRDNDWVNKCAPHARESVIDRVRDTEDAFNKVLKALK